jgi:hypothetical protein
MSYRTSEIQTPKTVWCFKEGPNMFVQIGFYILLGMSVVTFLIALGHLIDAPAYSMNAGFWVRVLGFLTLSLLGAWRLGLEKRSEGEKESAWKALASSEVFVSFWQVAVFFIGIVWIAVGLYGLWSFFSWSLKSADASFTLRLGAANTIVSGLCYFLYYKCEQTKETT